ncbi:MAG: hypothetical protein AAF085_04590 [Planctomycetota bacterium]
MKKLATKTIQLPMTVILTLAIGLTSFVTLGAEEGDAFQHRDPKPQRYKLEARASKIDNRAKEHPAINFAFESKGKPADTQRAAVDTRVAPRGKLVIWLMAYNGALFDRLADYGLHAIQVHYARGWFSKLHGLNDADTEHIGRIRLEAATGKDFSTYVDIPQPDGMMERAYRFVKHLAETNPQGQWGYYLTEDGKGLRWEHVIVAGSSHGSTTAARFAKYQKVSRVVMFSGPRDQTQTWQSLPSATPANRFFGFTHVDDAGWPDHYQRSWQMLGLEDEGPVVNVDEADPPYQKSRQLISRIDVGDANRAHSASTPGTTSPKDKGGNYRYEDVWKYLFTYPIE